MEAALYHALASLQQYHADHYSVEDEDVEDDPSKPFNNLQNSLLNILRPQTPKKPQSTYLLQPELYRQEEGVPTLVHNNIFLPTSIFNSKYEKPIQL